MSDERHKESVNWELERLMRAVVKERMDRLRLGSTGLADLVDYPRITQDRLHKWLQEKTKTTSIGLAKALFEALQIDPLKVFGKKPEKPENKFFDPEYVPQQPRRSGSRGTATSEESIPPKHIHPPGPSRIVSSSAQPTRHKRDSA
jgi:hypothetical protein